MSKTFLIVAAALALGALLALAQPATGDRPLVPYPDGYRAWRHVGSVVNEATDKNRATTPHGTIHHLYANDLALEGLRTGAFPEGAVFVADWFSLKEKYPGGFEEGARLRLDVMVRDARFAATGGWGFDQFAGDSITARNVAPGAAPKQCFECHTRASARGYVFTRPPL
ncbi:MAG: cytochrome P460 family protein [Opitutae bacterium]|nr:cytochrome P460 family protein [Opitutae bacterium]